MRLDRLEVRGFKSFRDKTEIVFPDKFTAIVGPNGSGKSNLTEAVCFVLGKSRGLRANALQDLIFNGAKEGTPAKKTVVSLTLSDDDGKTYRISRMVDIEGRSLYKLNDQRVTRDKVIDIVGDSEYNILLQDDITRVIEMKPTERRVIIDDLCGIGEYDKKKAKAVKELEKVEDKISETHIVLGEKQSQLTRLRKERDDALKYKSVQDEVRQSKASLLNHNIGRIEKRVAKTEERLSELGKEKEARNIEASGVKDKIAVERDNLREISKKILSLEEGRSRTRYTELSSEIRGCEERLGFLSERETALNSELSEYTSGRGELAQEFRRIDGELSEVIRELEAVSKNVSHESKKTHDSKLEKEFEEAQTAVLELKSREKAVSESIAEKREILSRKVIEENEIHGELDVAASERVTIAKNISDFEESYRIREKNYAKLREKLGKDKDELSKLEKTLEDLQLQEARKKTQLKTLEEAGGGVKGAVKAVMRLKDVLPGIHGTVSQLGAVSEERFEMALQVAAGSRLQNIVVQDVDVAGKCISYLKKKQIGRATFLPLSKINVRVSDETPKDALGFARDFIKTDEKYKKVFEYVFGDTLLVKDLKTAEKIGVGKFRMVTLEGDLLEISGALTGGHITKSVEIGFSNLEEIEKEIKDLERRISELSEKEENLKADVVQAEAKLLDYQKLVDAKTEVEKLRVEQKRVDDRVGELKRRLKTASSEKREADEKIASLEGELSSLESQKKSSEKALTKLLEERRKHNTTVIDELKKKETDLKVREGSLSEKKRTAEERTTSMELKITKLDEEKKRVVEEKKYKDKELENLKKEFSVVESESATMGEEIKNLLNMRDKAESTITELSANVASIDYATSEISEKISQILVEKAKGETELEALKQEFGKYEGVELIDAPVSNLERSIMTLERQLEDFGSINMKAIEAFDQFQRDYEQIESKLNTLKDERQSIFDFMEQVERKKYEVFMKAFEVVKQNFEQIFHKLSDGEGTLILDNPKSISESGLIIKASPAGKKIMNLEAMSGGEKVLTSAAFLLAIQQYKPAHFYIIDELDAALDKANSVRLAQMLKDSDAQFILVTHNNAIIKYAKSVVGVSMQNGVSHIVEVKLEA